MENKEVKGKEKEKEKKKVGKKCPSVQPNKLVSSEPVLGYLPKRDPQNTIR